MSMIIYKLNSLRGGVIENRKRKEKEEKTKKAKIENKQTKSCRKKHIIEKRGERERKRSLKKPGRASNYIKKIHTECEKKKCMQIRQVKQGKRHISELERKKKRCKK